MSRINQHFLTVLASCDNMKQKVYAVSTYINNEIVQWYIRSGYKDDLNEFRPGFLNNEEYELFMGCFEILRSNQTEVMNEDQLLYNFIIYYYILVIVECYILDYSYYFKSLNNDTVNDWMYSFSQNNSDWASAIRRKLLNFNCSSFQSFPLTKFNKFNPYEQKYLKYTPVN